MPDQRNPGFWYSGNYQLILAIMVIVLGMSNCARDRPALIGNANPAISPSTPASTSACSCTTSSPGTTTAGSSTNTPVSSTTASPPPQVDTLDAPPPRFIPNGGNVYFNTTVRLTADTLPAQAVYEFSLDNGQNWQSGQQFALTTGGKVLTRFRVGTKISGIRSVSFSIYFQRMMVIGNSIMLHPPNADLGWSNTNGMAASAPEKDFVHLLTGYLSHRNPQLSVRLQQGNNFELDFGKSTYSIDEFNQPLQAFKPDLIILRIGENVNDSEVQSRNFEFQFRQLVERLAGYGQPVKIVTTTSVWYRPKTDAVIRKVISEKSHPLVDLSCMVGQPQYFAFGQYAVSAVSEHPNDTGMQAIADRIWAMVQ